MWVLLKGKSSRIVGNIWLDWNCKASQEKWHILLFYFHRRSRIWDLKPFTYKFLLQNSIFVSCLHLRMKIRIFLNKIGMAGGGGVGHEKGSKEITEWGDSFLWTFRGMTKTGSCCLVNLLEVWVVCISVYLGVGEEEVVISVHECCAELPACIQTCI